MAKYIDKDVLKKEIKQLQSCTMDINMEFFSEKAQGEYNALSTIDYFIDTLEVKEMDLEKFLKEEIEDEWFDSDYGHIQRSNGTTHMTLDDVKKIAKHFFKFGLNASNSLTWEDMRELHIIFSSLDVDIELSRSKLQKETFGYYEEVLKRFKEQKKKML